MSGLVTAIISDPVGFVDYPITVIILWRLISYFQRKLDEANVVARKVQEARVADSKESATDYKELASILHDSDGRN